MRLMPRAYMNCVLLDSSTRSNVISPITQRAAMTTRLNMKKAVPRWETCPTKARAINPLETVPTKRLERHAQVVVFRRHDRDQLRGKLQARVFGRVLFHLSLLLSSDELMPFIYEEGSPDCSRRSAPPSGE